MAPRPMRYTEARMTDVATRLLEGIAENAVDFKPTYDGADEEPSSCPRTSRTSSPTVRTGIAVGMATSIPPHNVAELCDAALHLITQSRRRRTSELLQFIPGPDFPTGGILVGSRASHRPLLRDRPRLVPPARPLGARGQGPRRLPDHRHRDPLRRARSQARRKDRRAAAGEEAAAAQGHARRERRRHPPRPRAARRHGRSGDPDGAAVQALRSRAAHPAQPQRARQGHRPAR